MAHKNGIEYRVLGKDDEDAVIEVLQRHFIPEEPLCRHINMKASEQPHFPHLLVKNALWQRVSMGAFDEETGYLCAVLISILGKNGNVVPEAADLGMYTKEHCKILRLIDECKQTAPVDFNQNMEHIFLAVDKAYTRRGIASELYKRSQTQAIENGCKSMSVICSSYFSELSAANAGYDKKHQIFYKDHVDKVLDKRVFATVEPPHIGMSLMVKCLDTVY